MRWLRHLSSGRRLLKQTPDQYVSKQASKAAEDAAFKSALLSEPFSYDPQYISPNEVNPVSQRPVPINVELLQYKPLRHKPKHAEKCATITLRGYNEDDLIRAGEFMLRAAYYLNIPCSKLKTLKTEKRLYTVIRSPFAQAKSKENFHRVTYNREISAFDANPEVIDLWLSYVNKYALDTVEYKASITTRQGLEWIEDATLPEAYADLDDPVALKVKELLNGELFQQAQAESNTTAPEQDGKPQEQKETKREAKEADKADSKDTKKEAKAAKKDAVDSSSATTPTEAVKEALGDIKDAASKVTSQVNEKVKEVVEEVKEAVEEAVEPTKAKKDE
ncbi:hypothetical protein DIURU_002955 [Diutina rugosa]|uniref:Small ribosomal subunit protein uS10 domain-containing protein n=1 Tax=Diutina rugosa TaxID=5481 RepID=A0A642UPX2_DIURU|nr:uncharacterized protein DIURU_002955 [Diutina rugosa]KAA8902161.1 hypothetical protein DIURU_002955 [Diutina rugosa]